jgi:phenylalanyl-tRNA synthetase beta chain
LLEIAFFDPERIARTGQALQLTSDARARFERGVDPAFLDDGLAVLTGLILDICGGEASRVVRAGEPPVADKQVPFDPARTLSLGGLDVPADEQQAILERLGFSIQDGKASVPSWRRDVDGPADLVEEVARIAGYDRIPATPLPRAEGVARPTATRAQLAERRLRRMAAARGLDEAINWSFISADEADRFGGPADILANPISADMSHMRPSLLPGLIAAARRNLDRGAASVRLFEVGRRYLAQGERPTAALLLAGDQAPRGWRSGKAQPFSAFDAKAEALALLEAAGAPVASLQLFMNAGPTWHPGRSAKLGLGPKVVLAAFGELHPTIARDLPAGTVAAELYLDAIPEPRSAGRARAAFAPPALQSVTRDFAFLVPDELAADALVRAIGGADKAAIAGARIFDRYQPEGGQLSLAVEVALQPGEHSFTEAEIAEISKRIVAAAAKLGATLRS